MNHILLSHISVSDKVTVLTPTCNFKCIYCFFKPLGCKNYKAEDIARKILEVSEEFNTETVLIAGGEPTLQRDLPELTRLLYHGDLCTVISTNGSSADLVMASTVDEVHVDLKAIDSKKHVKLTGKSNRPVRECIEKLATSDDIQLEVATVLIPGIVDADEIRHISEFLSTWDVSYRITGYVDSLGNLDIPRPTAEEISRAAEQSREYLTDVSTSLEFKRHQRRLKVIRDL